MASRPYRMIPDNETNDSAVSPARTYRMIPDLTGEEQPQQPPASFMSELANYPGISAILGTGEGVKDVLSAGYNKPLYPDEGMASGLGRIGGNILGSFLPGGLAKAGLRAAEAIPGIGRIAEYLGSAKQFAEPIRNIGGNAALGSLLAGPEQRGAGAGWGAGWGAAGSLVGTAFGRNSPTMNKMFMEPVKKGIALFKKHFSHDQPFSANKGQGVKRIEEGYKKIVEQKNALYDEAFTDFGHELIVPTKMKASKDVMKEFEVELKEAYKALKENPSPENSAKFKNMVDNQKQLLSEKEATFGKLQVPEEFKKGWDSDLREMYGIYSKNPTFRNAHDFQSMLGKRKAQLNLTPIKDRNRIDNDEIQFLSDEQKRIKGNIESYLQANHPEIIEKYQKAAQFYKDKYLPYHIDRTISNMKGADNPIAKSGKQAAEIKRKTLERQAKVTDSAMVKAFSDIEDKPHVRSILEDVHPDFKRNILYATLGPAETYTPKQLIESVYRLDRKHLKSYGSPELSDDLLDLENQISVSREAMANFKKVKATIAGALTGGITGIPGAATFGAIVGNSARSLFPGSAAIGTSTFRKLREIPEMNKASVSGVLGDLLQKLLVSSGITSEKRKTERMELKLKGEK